jgi:hypothetical protein
MPKYLFIIAATITFAISMKIATAEMDFPEIIEKEVAVYPNAKIIQTLTASGTVMVMMEVGDNPDQVLAFYKKELTGNGWTIMTEVKQPGHTTLMSEKGMRNILIDSSLDQSGKSMVSLTLTPK